MSFSSESVKQRLNLSTQGYEVIQSDIFAFGATNLSGFVNRIFTYYAPKAEASISLVLRQREDALEKLSQSVSSASSEGESIKKRMVRKLLNQERGHLKDQIGAYGKEKRISFSLNRENLTYLSEQSECREEKYYKRRGDYIKAVLEEYARLPYVKRERIYFSPFINEIHAAIGDDGKDRRQLKIVTAKGRLCSLYPYGILCDPLSTANYLVGYSKRYDHPEDEVRPVSFRISALSSIRLEKSKRAFLPEEKWKQLRQTISSRGVQFLAGGEENIRVRLTEAGKEKYRRQIHLRPAYIGEPEGDVYVFDCTSAQAEFYFFKFGQDAEILQPSDLREKFIALYRNALDTYFSSKPDTPSGGSGG